MFEKGSFPAGNIKLDFIETGDCWSRQLGDPLCYFEKYPGIFNFHLDGQGGERMALTGCDLVSHLGSWTRGPPTPEVRCAIWSIIQPLNYFCWISSVFSWPVLPQVGSDGDQEEMLENSQRAISWECFHWFVPDTVLFCCCFLITFFSFCGVICVIYRWRTLKVIWSHATAFL